MSMNSLPDLIQSEIEKLGGKYSKRNAESVFTIIKECI